MKKKIIIPVAVVLLLAIGVGAFLLLNRGDDLTATTMRLLGYEGDVTYEKDGQEASILADMQIHSGNALATAGDSYADISLDDTKTVGLDEKSRAEFTQDGKALTVNLTKGGLYFYTTKELDDDESLDFTTNSTMVGIRGTSGYMFCQPNGETTLYLTSGEVEIKGINPTTGDEISATILAGESVTVYLDDAAADGESVSFTKDTFTEEDLPAFYVERISKEQEVFDRIVSESGLSRAKLLEIADAKDAADTSATNDRPSATEGAAADEEDDAAEPAPRNTTRPSQNTPTSTAGRTNTTAQNTADNTANTTSTTETANSTDTASTTDITSGLKTAADDIAEKIKDAAANILPASPSASTPSAPSQPTTSQTGTPKTVTGITINGAETSSDGKKVLRLAITHNKALTATVTYSDGSTSDSGVTWTSDNEAVATVKDGEVTAGNTTGTATITASIDDYSDEVEIEVLLATDVEVTLTDGMQYQLCNSDGVILQSSDNLSALTDGMSGQFSQGGDTIKLVIIESEAVDETNANVLMTFTKETVDTDMGHPTYTSTDENGFSIKWDGNADNEHYALCAHVAYRINGNEEAGADPVTVYRFITKEPGVASGIVAEFDTNEDDSGLFTANLSKQLRLETIEPNYFTLSYIEEDNEP